jgi:hypothetical protein
MGLSGGLSGGVTITDRIWLSSAAVVPQERGTDYFAPVDGADWSDGFGWHRGFFSSFRLRAGKDAWFHFPLPTPTLRDGKPMALAELSLMWETVDSARISWLVLQHGGMERLPLTERLQEPPSEPVPFDPPEQWRDYYPASARRLTTLPFDPVLPLRFGLQLCVGVSAPERDGTIRFYGAGAGFAEVG